MISINAIKTALKFMPISKEVKAKIEKNSEIMIDFRNFLSEKHSMSLKEVDNYIQLSIMNKIPEFDGLLDIASKASDITYEFAIEEGYTKANDLKLAIVELNETLKSVYNV